MDFRYYQTVTFPLTFTTVFSIAAGMSVTSRGDDAGAAFVSFPRVRNLNTSDMVIPGFEGPVKNYWVYFILIGI